METELCLETGISNWHDFAGDLKFLCGSFTRWGGPRDEVNFVHQTARDFFEEKTQKPCATVVDEIDANKRAANELLATMCIRYLLQDEIFWELERRLVQIGTHSAYVQMIQEPFSRNPLLRYAIESWPFHVREAAPPSSAISAMIREALSSPARREGILTFSFFINKQMSWRIPSGHTPLHFAVIFNIPWLAHIYISEDQSSVHALNNMHGTLLVWASEMGSIECVKELLDTGADPNEFEFDGWSALHWAAVNGHLGVAELLLEHGANLGQRDLGGRTPLDWAIDREHWDVAGLLREGSDIIERGRLDSASLPQG